MVLTERQILTDVINLYKDYRHLWDNKDPLYNNKEARDAAYIVMLEKYKLCYPQAAIIDLKKRIDNMRTTYRREHKKVLRAQMAGEEYVPNLWSYEHMQFLNEIGEWHIDFTPDKTIQISCKEEVSTEPRTKKRKTSDVDSYETKSFYLMDEFQQDNTGQQEEYQEEYQEEEYLDTVANNESTVIESKKLNLENGESEAFGKTVGLQLKSLEPLQRHIAEKLISDVIFNGRLNKLSVDSCIAKLSNGTLGM